MKNIAAVGDELHFDIDKVNASLDLYNENSNFTKDLLKILGYQMTGYIPAMLQLDVVNNGSSKITLSKYQKFIGQSFTLLVLQDQTIAPGELAEVVVVAATHNYTLITEKSYSNGTSVYEIPNSKYLYVPSLTVKDTSNLNWSYINTALDSYKVYDISYKDNKYSLITLENSNLVSVEFLSVIEENFSPSINYASGSFITADTGVLIPELEVSGFNILSTYSVPETNAEALTHYHRTLYDKTLISKNDFNDYLENETGEVCCAIARSDTYPIDNFDPSSQTGIAISALDNSYVMMSSDDLHSELDSKKYVDMDIDENHNFFIANWYLSGTITLAVNYTESVQQDMLSKICLALSEAYEPTKVGFGQAPNINTIKSIIYGVDSNIKNLDLQIKFKYGFYLLVLL